jgi:hypothetical protein
VPFTLIYAVKAEFLARFVLRKVDPPFTLFALSFYDDHALRGLFRNVLLHSGRKPSKLGKNLKVMSKLWQRVVLALEVDNDMFLQ